MENKIKFTILVEKYKNLIFTIAYQILFDEKLAENVCQDTLIKLFENINNIDEINCHKTRNYIIVICKRISIDYYRKRKNLKIVSLNNLSYKFNNRLLASDDYREEYRDILKEISELKDIYKEVLNLKFINEHTNSEIANELNITENTVRKRIERAKKMLKNDLNKKGWHIK